MEGLFLSAITHTQGGYISGGWYYVIKIGKLSYVEILNVLSAV